MLVAFAILPSRAAADVPADAIGATDETTYGPGSSVTTLPDGRVRVAFLPTYQRWDGTWRPTSALNRSAGEWPYLVNETASEIRVDRLGMSFVQGRAPNATYEFLPTGIKETFSIPALPTNPEIVVSLSTSHGLEADADAIRLNDVLGESAWTTAPFLAWDSGDPPRTWDRPISAMSYSDGVLRLILDVGMLADATYPLYVDPTWTLSAASGWGLSTFQDATEDQGDGTIKIGWFADNFNDNLIYPLRPSGDGSLLQWSRFPASGSHFDKVKEGAPDGDSTYVYSPTEGQAELFVVADLPQVGVPTVDYVEVHAVARVTAIQIEGPARIQLRVNGYGGIAFDLTMTYAEYAERWTTNPATGQAWTYAAVQALQAGVQVNYIDLGEVRVTQLFVLVKVTNPTVTTTYAYGKDDQLLREELLGLETVTTFAYDRNGNLKTRTTTVGTTTYTYDSEDRLTSVAGAGPSSTYGYAADGRRMKRVMSGATTYYGYDPSDFAGYEDVLEEYNAGGSKTATYVQGAGIDEPLAFKTSGAWSYYSKDALGSVTRITAQDGSTSSTYRYWAFGEIRSQTGANNTYGFTARENEPSLGLYYNRARYYEPRTGRFLSDDPIGFGGGMNRYSYAAGNPARWNDPSGMRLDQGVLGGHGHSKGPSCPPGNQGRGHAYGHCGGKPGPDLPPTPTPSGPRFNAEAFYAMIAGVAVCLMVAVFVGWALAASFTIGATSIAAAIAIDALAMLHIGLFFTLLVATAAFCFMIVVLMWEMVWS